MASAEIFAGVLELHVAVVAGGQRADLVDHVHQHLGAVLGQALAGDRVVGEHLLGFSLVAFRKARSP
jgi:hypothetical protein